MPPNAPTVPQAAKLEQESDLNMRKPAHWPTGAPGMCSLKSHQPHETLDFRPVVCLRTGIWTLSTCCILLLPEPWQVLPCVQTRPCGHVACSTLPSSLLLLPQLEVLPASAPCASSAPRPHGRKSGGGWRRFESLNALPTSYAGRSCWWPDPGRANFAPSSLEQLSCDM